MHWTSAASNQVTYQSYTICFASISTATELSNCKKQFMQTWLAVATLHTLLHAELPPVPILRILD